MHRFVVTVCATFMIAGSVEAQILNGIGADFAELDPLVVGHSELIIANGTVESSDPSIAFVQRDGATRSLRLVAEAPGTIELVQRVEGAESTVEVQVRAPSRFELVAIGWDIGPDLRMIENGRVTLELSAYDGDTRLHGHPEDGVLRMGDVTFTDATGWSEATLEIFGLGEGVYDVSWESAAWTLTSPAIEVVSAFETRLERSEEGGYDSVRLVAFDSVGELLGIRAALPTGIGGYLQTSRRDGYLLRPGTRSDTMVPFDVGSERRNETISGELVVINEARSGCRAGGTGAGWWLVLLASGFRRSSSRR